MKRLISLAMPLVMLVVVAGFAMGCEKKGGSLESLGKQADQAAQDTADALNK